MKRVFAFFLTLLLVISISINVFADVSSIIIKGQLAEIPKEMGSIKLISDRTFVPVRFVLENFGYEVFWDDANGIVLGRNADGSVFIMQLLNNKLVLKKANNIMETVEMDVCPVLDYNEGRTYIPIRFLAQAIGYKVDYEAETGTVIIN